MRERLLRQLRQVDGARAGPARCSRSTRRWIACCAAGARRELEKVGRPTRGPPARRWSFNDHLLAIEWIHQKWWSADEVRTEARAIPPAHSPFNGVSWSADLLIEQEAQRRQDKLFGRTACRWQTLSGSSFRLCCSTPVRPTPLTVTVAKLWRTISPSQFERRDARSTS